MTHYDSPGRAPFDSEQAWKELNERLFQLARKGMKLGLERLEPLLEKLGHPEKSTKFIHVAGTNGKGSTCVFLASILAQADLTVGVYTSPHLQHLTERLKWFSKSGAQDVLREEMMAAFDIVEELCPDFGPLTFFEVVTLVALILIADKKPDFGVIEAGLGARLDATRMVQAQLSILTDISLDHCAYLGDTIEEIAAEKLAVIRSGKPLVAAPDLDLVKIRAEQSKSRLYRLGDQMRFYKNTNGDLTFELEDRCVEGIRLGLHGDHQVRNALLAAQAATLLVPELTEDQLRAGLLEVQWPGRLEMGSTESEICYLLDAAHNSAGAEVLAHFLQGMPGAPWHFVFGAMADKDLAGIIHPLLPFGHSWVLTQGESPRFMQVSELKGLFSDLGVSVDHATTSPWAAFEKAASQARQTGGTVVICGSIFLIGELRGKLARPSRRVLG
jgi:dihydrofolate synthase / folylpolyglutamate synthase